MLFSFSRSCISLLTFFQHALPELRHLKENAIVGLDVGTTRSTVSILDHTTGKIHVLTIMGAGAVVGVTYLSSEFVHYEGDEHFDAGLN